MTEAKVTTLHLWPTPVMLLELDAALAAIHNPMLIAQVFRGCAQQRGSTHELRFHDLHHNDSEAVRWLSEEVRRAASWFCGYTSTAGIHVGLRGVQINRGGHINTHTEARESDLGVAYWPSGDPARIGTVLNQNADGVRAPTFVLEDPSRHLSDLRLPQETRHSVNFCPRPGLLAIYPAHLPHNVHPYWGDEPFIQIVAQVRMPWPATYFRE